MGGEHDAIDHFQPPRGRGTPRKSGIHFHHPLAPQKPERRAEQREHQENRKKLLHHRLTGAAPSGHASMESIGLADEIH